MNAGNTDEKAGLFKLMHECQPASFGYKGEDVLDESYRKATKMDRSAFSADFCPYELGIIEQTGFSQYILIVRDFATFAREKGIYFGVRGSAASATGEP